MNATTDAPSITCLVCEATKTVALDRARRRCRACGFVFAECPEDVASARYDLRYGGDDGGIDDGRRPLYAALLRRVPAFGGRRCLDIGSGGGLFVRMAAEAGWDAVGIDPAGPETEGPHVRLIRGAFPACADEAGGPFALITFLGSLNYMTDPVAALRAAHALLDPGGLLLIRVPNVAVHLAVGRVAAALGARSRVGAWLLGGTILHARSFSVRALAVALDRAGFTGARIDGSAPVPGDPYGSGAPAIGRVKRVVGPLTQAVALLSARRILWTPSLEARAVRTAGHGSPTALAERHGCAGPRSAGGLGGSPRAPHVDQILGGSRRAPHVLHIITRLTLGGSSEASIAQVEALQAAGYACTLAVGVRESDADVLVQARARGCRLVDIPTLGREAAPSRDLRALFALVRLMRRERPVLVHTHTSKAGFLGRLAARITGVPAVLHQPHGHILYGYYGPCRTRVYAALERLAARWADRLVVLTDHGADEHLAHGIGRPGQFVTVPSGVPTARLRAAAPPRATARARLGMPPTAFVIVGLGRLVPIKGYDVLIEALPAVVAALPDTRLLLVGGGPLRPDLETQAARLGMTDRVTITGVTRDVVTALAAADVLVAPSRNEGMGRAIVEAMALGVPPVGTRVGGIPSVIVDGECGRVVPPEDALALARALIELGRYPGARAKLGEAARRRAELFSTEEATRCLLALYATALNGTHGSNGASRG
jgi:glycosyltransferase involved in cell wall biosynthesis/SAM-dependent methyltransferase